ncbi:outer membrane protein assembly factor BamB family protein [Halogeometricum limi]|uniref:Outer membrane protein assembly factor BamB, contains PQQ-like beta-propeller repeat n=1 Tax=Halogeometricum limi TaxID=555875 RepID=A0A1I6HAM6_9EURY|nr:PQQ-binding-like beta-propeller repeat protein [Halogeometricum limi]SFR51420.1 Outer membrane protein assembly factor BamB, contains PQQ-like beta-propeller repeat [Halogeometricum limi]
MPSLDTLSRREALAAAGLLCVGGSGGFLLRDEFDDRFGDDSNLPADVAPTDWPHPARDAAHTRHAPPESAPDARETGDGLDRAWSFERSPHGPERTRPVVANGTVFVAESRDAGPSALRAVDRTGGDERWAVRMDDASGAVVAVGDRVLHLHDAVEGTVLDARAAADGSLLWRRDEPGDSGLVGLPVVAGSRAYVGGSQGRTAVLGAHGLGGGRAAWRRSTDGSFLGPPAVDRRASTVVLQTLRGLAAFDTTDGERRWRDTFEQTPDDRANPNPYGWPLLADGRAFVATYEGLLRAYDFASGEVDWERRLDASGRYAHVFEPGAYADGVLFTVERFYDARPDVLHAVDAESGADRWTVAAADAGEGSLSNPTVCDGRVYLTLTVDGDDHELLRLDAGDGSVVDRTALSSFPYRAPIVAGGRVLVSTGDGFDVFR